MLRAMNLKVAVMKRESSFSELHIDVFHMETSFQLKGFSMIGVARAMLDGDGYTAVVIVIRIVCCFLDNLTGYKNCPRINKAHEIYRIL